MKKIFILKGGDDTGKTTKINHIIDWILTNYTILNSVVKPINQIDRYGIIQINKLTIGFNTAGDNETEVKKIDNLNGLLNNYNELDIIICACRTKGKGRQYIINNYNYSNGWLQKFINIEKFPKADVVKQSTRDIRKIEELKTWLVGLEKL
ncbi:hypothetical protein [Flavobacterium sp. SM2513]|uniref:hypothetical protein n=1 Tax=Flavobacterium sp. SM2513 TaxID=3424766 RepID=UPI003D7F6533